MGQLRDICVSWVGGDQLIMSWDRGVQGLGQHHNQCVECVFRVCLQKKKNWQIQIKKRPERRIQHPGAVIWIGWSGTKYSALLGEVLKKITRLFENFSQCWKGGLPIPKTLNIPQTHH